MGVSDTLLDGSKTCNQPKKSVVLNIENDRSEVDDAEKMLNGNPNRSSPKKKNFNRSQHHFSPRDRRRKLQGVRHLRRIENLNILLSQVEADEDESGEVDFVDLVSHQNSAFRELFVAPEKMSAWVAFVNSSEEEQENVLLSNEKVKLHDIFESLDNTEDFEDINDVNSDDDAVNHNRSKRRSFAVTAHECFQRINRNLRTFLRHSHLPSGELHRLEEELVEFFVEWPSSVYVTDLPDGYRRMLLHAVSQYLDLDARSFNVPGSGDKRQTQVENNRNQNRVFVPPPTPLAAYISSNK